MSAPKRKPRREWLVIESAYKHAAFFDPKALPPDGCIPRDVAEKLLGRVLGGDDCQWFSREESDLIRSHPEFTLTLTGKRKPTCRPPDIGR